MAQARVYLPAVISFALSRYLHVHVHVGSIGVTTRRGLLGALTCMCYSRQVSLAQTARSKEHVSEV